MGKQGSSVGSLRNIPAPSATVFNEALKLLSTFGDSKSLSGLLEQMREVQTDNEKVFLDAQSVLADVRVEQHNLEESRRTQDARMTQENAALERRIGEVVKAEAKLNARIDSFNNERAETDKKLSETTKDLDRRERLLYSREINCSNKEQGLLQRTNDLQDLSMALDDRQKQLESRERKLRAALDGE